MNDDLLRLLACPCCEGRLEFGGDAAPAERLLCLGCKAAYEIQHGVPCLLAGTDRETSATSQLYSDIWEGYEEPPRPRGYDAPATGHLALLELASGRPLVQDGVGIDAGCGSGKGTLEIAARYPRIRFLGIDLADGVVRLAESAEIRDNVHLVRGDLLRPPLRRELFDFAFSFGVLHHIVEPERAFRLLLERLKPGGRICLFVYKDFSDIPLKRLALKAVNSLRRITTRLRPRTLRRLAWLLAPLVFAGLTIPARFLRSTGLARFARHIPYGTFPDLVSVASSLEDRFGAPYEHRFSERDLHGWAARAELNDVRVVDCLPWGFSGLVLAGFKKRDERRHHAPRLQTTVS